MERVREHVPPCVQRFIKDPMHDYTDDVQLVRASKKSAIAEHLLKNREFSVLKQCGNDYELKVHEAVLIGIMCPTLCTQTKFDYVMSLV